MSTTQTTLGKGHLASLETITYQTRLTSTLCGQFVSTIGCSRGEHWFPWPPGADFSTTKPYLAVAKETGSVYLALCPCLLL